MNITGEPVTIVFRIVDEAEFRKHNLLKLEIAGMKATGCAAYDALEKLWKIEETINKK